MKNTLILQGNPNKESLTATAAQNYYMGALKNSKNVELIHLTDNIFLSRHIPQPGCSILAASSQPSTIRTER